MLPVAMDDAGGVLVACRLQGQESQTQTEEVDASFLNLNWRWKGSINARLWCIESLFSFMVYQCTVYLSARDVGCVTIEITF